MIRVTPDTNVLVSAFFFDGNEREVLEAAIERRVRFVLSLELMDELIRVLDEKFQVDWEMLWAYSFRLSQVADLVRARKLSDLAVRDRKDVKVLECAEAGGSRYIVTGDRDLLSLERYKGISIVTAARLLKTLKRPRTLRRKTRMS